MRALAIVAVTSAAVLCLIGRVSLTLATSPAPHLQGRLAVLDLGQQNDFKRIPRATDTLTANQQLLASLATGLVSSDGLASLEMQHDGNLVMKALSDTGIIVLWATQTSGSNAKLVFQSDGNLVIYNGPA